MRPCNLGIGDQRLTLLDIISDVCLSFSLSLVCAHANPLLLLRRRAHWAPTALGPIFVNRM